MSNLSSPTDHDGMLKLLKTAHEWGLVKDLAGQSYCLTGTASVTRSTFQTLIIVLGGRNHSSIRPDTKFLIVGEGAEVSNLQTKKLDNARKQGVIVITESQFCEMIIPSLADLRGDSDVRTKDG